MESHESEARFSIILSLYVGVGKTTLVRGVVSRLCQQDNLCLQGFYTEDVRHGGRGPRIGFDVVTLDGQRSPLARVRE